LKFEIICVGGIGCAERVNRLLFESIFFFSCGEKNVGSGYRNVYGLGG